MNLSLLVWSCSFPEAVKPSSTPRCGISLIWVTRRHRRKGLGTRMLDCIRNHFCRLNYKYGNVMEKSSVAFTEPSDEGLKFIAAYMEGNAANIYLWDNLKIHEWSVSKLDLMEICYLLPSQLLILRCFLTVCVLKVSLVIVETRAVNKMFEEYCGYVLDLPAHRS